MSCLEFLFNNVGYQYMFAGYQFIVMAIIYFIEFDEISGNELSRNTPTQKPNPKFFSLKLFFWY